MVAMAVFTPQQLFDAASPLVPMLADMLIGRRSRHRIGAISRLAIDRDDLIQVGYVALWELAQEGKYDPAVASPRTFAEPRVRGAMIDWLRLQRPAHGGNHRQVIRGEAAGYSAPRCVSLSRRNRQTRDDWQDEPTAAPADEVADDDVAEVASLVRRSNALLSHDERDTLVEYLTSGRTMREIADLHGTHESCVCVKVNNALDEIRRSLAAAGRTSLN